MVRQSPTALGVGAGRPLAALPSDWANRRRLRGEKPKKVQRNPQFTILVEPLRSCGNFFHDRMV